MATVRVLKPDGGYRYVTVPGDCATAAQVLFSQGLVTAGCAGGATDAEDPPPVLALETQVSGSFLSRLGAAAVGFVAGGPAGAVGGFITDPFSLDDTPPPIAGGSNIVMQQDTCPAGTTRILGRCLDLEFGGDTQGEGVFVPEVNGNGAAAGDTSAVGVPHVPGRVARSVRKCRRGYVLADLGNGVRCFHRKLLPNRLRLYPKAQAPALSARDKRMIRKYAKGGTKATQVAELAKDLGFHVSNAAPKRKKKS